MSTPFEAYLQAKDVLTCRMIAEPYNMTAVAGLLHDQMFMSDDVAVLACRQLYASRQVYSAYTVAQKSGLPIDLVQGMATRYPDTTLQEAFDVFQIQFGRYVEFEIGQNVGLWIKNGLSAEQIRLEGDKYRRHKGVLKGSDPSDGQKEFEADLIKALRGEALEYAVKTPLASFRQFLPYFEPGEYIIAAGRTGMGKSYFGLNCLFQCALDGVPAAYVNLENTPKDVQKRLWQMRSQRRFDRDMSAISDHEARVIHDSWEWVKRAPIKVLNTGRSLTRILNTIRQDHLERGTQFFCVDYVQLIRDGESKRQRFDELGEISGALRALALELNIPIMGIAQVNREAEKSGNKRPQLSDLRGSGDLEQDATAVLLLYRPGYYDILTDDDGTPYPEDYADVHVAKGRNSGTARIKCRFSDVLGFYDAAPETAYPGPSQSRLTYNDYTIANRQRRDPEADLPF